jgi:hypothetical protein
VLNIQKTKITKNIYFMFMFRLCLYMFHENKNFSFSQYKNPRSSVFSNVHHNLDNLVIIPKVTKLMKLIRFKLINLKYKLQYNKL